MVGMKTNLADIRQEYKKSSLSKKHVESDPLVQFDIWLNETMISQVPEPTAMIIATVDEAGQPFTRTVLLKGVDEGRFVFYTNYLSRKGQNLAQNPHISATFFWKELERQVHIQGLTEKAPSHVSDDYFKSRPWTSQVGARISPQSQPIRSRNTIKIAFAKETFKLAGQEVPRPENWGGYYIIPNRIEFWQGRPSRLHDRIVYTRQANNLWKIERLAP